MKFILETAGHSQGNLSAVLLIVLVATLIMA